VVLLSGGATQFTLLVQVSLRVPRSPGGSLSLAAPSPPGFCLELSGGPWWRLAGEVLAPSEEGAGPSPDQGALLSFLRKGGPGPSSWAAHGSPESSERP